jgi:hypothetical protein
MLREFTRTTIICVAAFFVGYLEGSRAEEAAQKTEISILEKKLKEYEALAQKSMQDFTRITRENMAKRDEEIGKLDSKNIALPDDVKSILARMLNSGSH